MPPMANTRTAMAAAMAATSSPYSTADAPSSDLRDAIFRIRASMTLPFILRAPQRPLNDSLPRSAFIGSPSAAQSGERMSINGDDENCA
jgi:hypothetical protein